MVTNTIRDCRPDDTLDKYTSWVSEKQDIFTELLTILYEELKKSPTGNEPRIKELSDETKDKARRKLTEIVNGISLKLLKEEFPKIKEKGVQNWIKKQDKKIQEISKKTLPQTKRVTRSQAKTKKVYRPRKPLSKKKGVEINEGKIIKNYVAKQKTPPQKKLVKPSAKQEKLTKMPIEISADALWVEFSETTDSALIVSENMTEGEVNPFASQLKKCKEILKEQESYILLAQKVKETILLYAAVYKRISSEVPKAVYGRVKNPANFMKDFEFVLRSEYGRIFYPLKNVQEQLKSYLGENGNAWEEMIKYLRQTREDFRPLDISKEGLEQCKRHCIPTSSELPESVEPRINRQKKQQERIQTRDSNYKLSYLCLKQMVTHCTKLNHRKKEIDDNYYNNPKVAQYKDKEEIGQNHILNNNNKKEVINNGLKFLYEILSSKEIIELVLRCHESMGKEDQQKYLKAPYGEYKKIFDKIREDLRSKEESQKEILTQTIELLEKVIEENVRKDYTKTDKAALQKANSPKDYENLLQEVQDYHARWYAATIQKIILEELLKKIQERMHVKETDKASYLTSIVKFTGATISEGFIPLYEKFSDLITSGEKEKQ